MNRLNVRKYSRLFVFALLVNLLPGCASSDNNDPAAEHPKNLSVLEDNNVSLEDFIKGKSVVVVDFYADWCGPCRVMKPLFKKMAIEFEDLSFLMVNIDKHMAAAQAQGVSTIPTFIIYKDGKAVDKLMGQESEAKLKEFIEKNK